MGWKDHAKRILKGAVGFFVVGAVLTLAAQLIAPAMGLELGPLTLSKAGPTNPLWTGAYFGAFGALNNAVVPLVDKLFGETPVPVIKAEENHGAMVSPALELTSEPGMKMQHTARLEAQRQQAPSLERQV